MTAFSRAEFSLGGGRASRYVYVLVVLLLPLCGVALTRIAAKKNAWRAGVLASLTVLVVYQGTLSVSAAKTQSDIERGSQRLISAAISLSIVQPETVNPAAVVDTSWAPDVTLADLLELYDEGVLPISQFSADDMARARAAVAR